MFNTEGKTMLSWQSLLTTLGIGSLSVAATLAITWIRSKALKWGKRINNPIIEQLNIKLDEWIDDSINTVNKNFVDKLKETGDWEHLAGVFNKEIYKKNSLEALDRCLISLKSRIPKPFKKLVGKYYEDVDLFYKNRIDERMKEHELARKQEEEKIKEAKIIKATPNTSQDYSQYPQSSAINQY